MPDGGCTRPLPLGSLPFGPAPPWGRRLIGPICSKLITARPAGPLIQRNDPRRLRLVLGIGLAFQVRVRWNDSPAAARTAEVRRGDLHSASVRCAQGAERPAGQRHPQRVGTGTGHATIRAAVRRDPAGPPAPLAGRSAIPRSLNAWITFRTYDWSVATFVAICGDRHPHRRGQQHRRSLPLLSSLPRRDNRFSRLPSSGNNGLTNTDGGRIITSSSDTPHFDNDRVSGRSITGMEH